MVASFLNVPHFRSAQECELFSIKYKDPSKAGPLGMLGISAEPASLRQVCLGTYSRVGRTPDHSPV